MKLAAAAVALVLPVSLLSACGTEDQPDVVAAFYPLQYVAERISGEHLTVANLTAPGVEPHDLELTVRQRSELGGAKVVIFETGLQPSVDKAVTTIDGPAFVDAAEVVDLHPVDAAEHAEHENEHEEGHDHGSLDPHFWLDPTLLAEVAGAYADAVTEADPDHASSYRANLTALIDDLTELDGEFRAGLADCARDAIVVSHDAFGYLGSRYGLDVVPISGISPDAEPSAKRLGELRKVVRKAEVSTIFSETLAPPDLAETLADDVGVRTDVLDPLEGLTSASDGEDYLSVMRSNLARLERANSC